MNLSGVQWLAGTEALEPDYCFTFARGLRPVDLLSRMRCDVSESSSMTADDAADFISAQDDDDDFRIVIRAGQTGDWVFAMEDGSIYGGQPEVLRSVAENTEVACLYRTIRGYSGFSYARDGRIVAGLVSTFPFSVSGSDPTWLTPALVRVGLEPGDSGPFSDEFPWQAILRMCEQEFSLSLPVPGIFVDELLAAPVLYG